MNSTQSRSHQKPHLSWAIPTDMATAIAMPASAATGSSAGRLDGRSGRAPEDGAAEDGAAEDVAAEDVAARD